MDEAQRLKLIRQATRGDADALQALIVEYHGALRACVERRSAGPQRSLVDPDDVLQDTYVAAFRTVAGLEFKSPAAFYGWLERIAVTRLIDPQRAAVRKKRNRGRTVNADSSANTRYDGLAQTLISPDGTPSHFAARSEAVAAVLTSLARLTEDQRDVIRLRFLEGLPVGEVASRLGKSDDAVHALSRRGLNALRESLGSLSRFLSRL